LGKKKKEHAHTGTHPEATNSPPNPNNTDYTVIPALETAGIPSSCLQWVTNCSPEKYLARETNNGLYIRLLHL